MMAGIKLGFISLEPEELSHVTASLWNQIEDCCFGKNNSA